MLETTQRSATSSSAKLRERSQPALSQ